MPPLLSVPAHRVADYLRHAPLYHRQRDRCALLRILLAYGTWEALSASSFINRAGAVRTKAIIERDPHLSRNAVLRALHPARRPRS